VGKRRFIVWKAQWTNVRHPWEKLTIETENRVVFAKLPRVGNLALTNTCTQKNTES